MNRYFVTNVTEQFGPNVYYESGPARTCAESWWDNGACEVTIEQRRYGSDGVGELIATTRYARKPQQESRYVVEYEGE